MMECNELYVIEVEEENFKEMYLERDYVGYKWWSSYVWELLLILIKYRFKIYIYIYIEIKLRF